MVAFPHRRRRPRHFGCLAFFPPHCPLSPARGSPAPQLKREQLKREGKLLTGKAKEEAERRAAIAAQLLAKAAEKGKRSARSGTLVCHGTRGLRSWAGLV